MLHFSKSQTSRIGCGARSIFACFLALMLASTLGGCRWSDELFEIVHNDEAEEIDYETEQKNYVQSDTATTIMDWLEPVPVISDDEGLPQIETLVPVFGSPTNTEDPVAQVYYDSESDSDRTAPVYLSEEEEEENEENPPEESNQTMIVQQEGAGDEGNESDEEYQGDSSGESDDIPTDEGTDGVGPSLTEDRGTVINNQSGGLLAPLDVAHVAAVGEYANMVLMLGGPGTLVASDNTFLASEVTQRIFSGDAWTFTSENESTGETDDTWTLSSAVQVWTYDEDSDTYTVDFQALLDSGVDTVLIPEGYTLLSDAQKQTLIDAGIYVETMPAFDSTADIESMAVWLGDSLADGFQKLEEAGWSTNGYDPAARAAEYINTYLGSDIEALISENGGLTSYNNIDYSSGGHAISSIYNWTIFVTDWDESATYHATLENTEQWTATGIAIAKSGYGWSPLNYYLSVGGVNNNAAQFPDSTSAATTSNDYYVWQFALSTLNTESTNFTNVTKAVTALKNSGYAACLVRAPASFDDSSSYGDSNALSALGADDFGYVICASQYITEQFIAARDSSEMSLYKAHDWVQGTLVEGIGVLSTSGRLMEALIGNLPGYSVSNRASICAGKTPPYGVVTCANGLYCDWVNGSVESFLMAFWVDDFYDTGGTDFSSFRAEVSKFYQFAYGYTITDSDFSTICAGRVS